MSLFLKISRSSKTFKPKKNIPEGTHQYDLMKHAAATLGSGNLRNAVALPDGEDLNEWVAVNSKILLYHSIDILLTHNSSSTNRMFFLFFLLSFVIVFVWLCLRACVVSLQPWTFSIK